MKTRRIRVDFQKIIDGNYLQKDLLLIYQWLMRISFSCYEQDGWYRYGLHQSFHGYSHNNYSSEAYKLSKNWESIIYDGFVRLLCRTKHPRVVREFLEKERIQLGKIRVITITEENENYYYSKLTSREDLAINDIGKSIRHLTEAYKGLELKKEHFHPTLEGRLRPRIIDNVHFGTTGNKWHVSFTFSFECFNYEPGWNYSIYQKDNEGLSAFFSRSIEEIDSLLLPTTSCDNCPLWIKSNRGSYLRHGYRGGCKLYKTCNKPDVVKYKWESKNGRIVDNAIHDSIVFPYFRKQI